MRIGTVEKQKGHEGQEQAGDGDPAHIYTQGDGGDIGQPHGGQVDGLGAVPDPGDRVVDVAVFAGDESFSHHLDDGEHICIGDIDGAFVEPVLAPGPGSQDDQAGDHEAIVIGTGIPAAEVDGGGRYSGKGQGQKSEGDAGC